MGEGNSQNREIRIDNYPRERVSSKQDDCACGAMDRMDRRHRDAY